MRYRKRFGAKVITSLSGRGRQLAAGAEQANGDWLLFLHADTTLEQGWKRAVDEYIADPANQSRAAAFRFALDDGSARRGGWSGWSPGALRPWRCRMVIRGS